MSSYPKYFVSTVLFSLCSLLIAGHSEAQLIMHDKTSWDLPVLIAHRGGVVSKGVSENTIRALELAKEQGFSMVEVDIRESKDHVPIAFHDKFLTDDIGIDARIEDLAIEEIQELSFKKTGLKIPTLDEYLARCSELEIGVMLDIKSELRQKGKPADGREKVNATEEFYSRIANLVKKYDLGLHSITIDRHPLAQKHLKGVVMMRITIEEEKKIRKGEKISINGKFWFGWPRHISENLITVVQEQNVLVIPSINIQHYPEAKHKELAQKDINRMIEAGVDAFQIDGAYADFVKEGYEDKFLTE